MKIIKELSSEATGANEFAETILTLISPAGERWGYTTRDTSEHFELYEMDITEDDKDIMHQFFFDPDWPTDPKSVYKAYIAAFDLYVYLYWDGDGTMVFHSKEENWFLYNHDCKKDYTWHWIKNGIPQ